MKGLPTPEQAREWVSAQETVDRRRSEFGMAPLTSAQSAQTAILRKAWNRINARGGIPHRKSEEAAENEICHALLVLEIIATEAGIPVSDITRPDRPHRSTGHSPDREGGVMTGTPGPYRSDDGTVYLDNLPLLSPIKRRHGPSEQATADMASELMNRGEHFEGLVEALDNLLNRGGFGLDAWTKAEAALAKARGEIA